MGTLCQTFSKFHNIHANSALHLSLHMYVFSYFKQTRKYQHFFFEHPATCIEITSTLYDTQMIFSLLTPFHFYNILKDILIPRLTWSHEIYKRGGFKTVSWNTNIFTAPLLFYIVRMWVAKKIFYF